MNIPKRCDFLVIGGGPTGSSVAKFLHEMGYDVVVFDRKRHPRYAVGESLIPHVWKYLDLMGVSPKIEAEGFIRKSGGTVVWNGAIKQMTFGAFGYARPAMHVERDRFDHILLEHTKEAGVPVFEETIVQDVAFGDEGGARVTYKLVGEEGLNEIACEWVLDASGQSGVIAKKLGLREIDDAFRFMSLWGYFADSRYFATDGKAHEFSELAATPPTTFVSSIEGWGWNWHIPLRKTTSVGLVLPIETVKSLKSQGDLEGYFLQKCKEIPYLGDLLKNATYEGTLHAIRDYSYRPKQATGPGYYLLGDAAGFIDPIFSVGVPLGMYSSYVAAWSLDRTMRDKAGATKNRALYEKQFMARLEMSRALALPCYTPPGKASEVLKDSISFEASIEQELIHVVTTMTTRGSNFETINSQLGGKTIHSDKYWSLDTLQV